LVLLSEPENVSRHARLCAGYPRLGHKKDVDGRVKPGHDGVIEGAPE
jgi:hypothetical protein